MQEEEPQRVGVLLIRAWMEGGRLRARITRTLDVSRAEQVTSATASIDEVYDVVRLWLETFLAGPEGNDAA